MRPLFVAQARWPPLPIDELYKDYSSSWATDEVPVSMYASFLIRYSVANIAHMPFCLPAVPLEAGLSYLEPMHWIAIATFGSNDKPLDLKLQVESSSIAGVEDACVPPEDYLRSIDRPAPLH
uniref:Uncharacterized protein n=1 Tax=Oryza glumipatula TaxID=40148 RepID=A0A0E0B2B7_9ORYZ